MFDTAGKPFFGALRQAVEGRLGRGHPCFAAVDRAAREEDAVATEAAQKALAALDPDVASSLMADVHRALREYPAGILGAWRCASAGH